MGITAVIASSFARIFYRNAINIGLPVVEIGTHSIRSGARVTVDLENGRVTNHSTSKIYAITAIPDVMLTILEAGGLVNYLQKAGDY